MASSTCRDDDDDDDAHAHMCHETASASPYAYRVVLLL